MDLNAVSVFVKVVQSGSFSEAARRLKMPKSTVSARVAGLESALGLNLIQRTTRKLHVTEAGARYFAHCVKALQTLDEGHAELTAASNRPQGTLRVTAPVDLGQTLLPKIVHAFLQAHPDVQVEMLVLNRVVDLVGEGIDLGLRAGELKDSSLIGRRFFDHGANLWASPAYLDKVGRPTRPKDLLRCDFVAFSSMPVVHLWKGKTLASVPMTGRVRCDDLASIKAMVLMDEGIGWLPDFLVSDEAAQGSIEPALRGWKARGDSDIHFVYPGLKGGSANVRAFIEAALSVVSRG